MSVFTPSGPARMHTSATGTRKAEGNGVPERPAGERAAGAAAHDGAERGAAREAVIRVAKLNKVYQTGEVRVHALRGVDLTIYRGDFVALMGSSGSGKSTLMNMLGCLDRPTGGKYFLGDADVSSLGRDALAEVRNRRLGFIFQGFNLLSRTSALDNVKMPLLYSGRLRGHKANRRAAELLDMVGLGGRLDHMPNQLSGGQQQRVAIARSLVNDPDILLADEPTGNLDTRTGLEILSIFQRLNRESNQTIIMVTHDRAIADCCRRQIWMQDGEIIKDQPTENWRDAAKELAALEARRERGDIPLGVAS